MCLYCIAVSLLIHFFTVNAIIYWLFACVELILVNRIDAVFNGDFGDNKKS